MVIPNRKHIDRSLSPMEESVHETGAGTLVQVSDDWNPKGKPPRKGSKNHPSEKSPLAAAVSLTCNDAWSCRHHQEVARLERSCAIRTRVTPPQPQLESAAGGNVSRYPRNGQRTRGGPRLV